MIAAATDYAEAGRVEFLLGDVSSFDPDDEVDVVVANAVFHWVPDHLEVIARLASRLAAGGALAFQVPDNFDAPSHRLITEVCADSRWRDALADYTPARVYLPEQYVDTLHGAGLQTDVWQTTYQHELTGENAVLEWLRGTALRQILDLLGETPTAQAFLDDLGARLAQAYPTRRDGRTVFPFTRTFAVGHVTMEK